MRVFGSAAAPAPTIQRKGKPAPTALIEHRETRYVEELRGKPGKNGVDGVNAFPTATVVYNVAYRRDRDPKVRFYRGLTRSSSSVDIPPDFKTLFESGEPVVFNARQYRFTIAADVEVVCPVGIRIQNINPPPDAQYTDDLRGVFIPNKIVLPSYISNIPEFDLRLYVEFLA